MDQAAPHTKPAVPPWNRLVIAGVSLLLIGWLFSTPSGILGKADAIGYAVCHRIDLRSFHLGERQLALCARCTGMYLGAVVALVFQVALGRRRTGLPPRSILFFLAVLALAFIVDGLNSFVSLIPGLPTLYQPQNWSRLLTGTGMGVVIAAALFPGFNQTVWENYDRKPAIGGWAAFLLLLGIALLFDLMVLSGNPYLLYPLSLVSASGVLLILTLVYSMVWVLLLRSENRYVRLSQMLFPLVGGFGFALLQIALLDFGRFLLTGTWDGFHLG